MKLRILNQAFETKPFVLNILINFKDYRRIKWKKTRKIMTKEKGIEHSA